jgi:hypothetical protein
MEINKNTFSLQLINVKLRTKNLIFRRGQSIISFRTFQKSWSVTVYDAAYAVFASPSGLFQPRHSGASRNPVTAHRMISG